MGLHESAKRRHVAMVLSRAAARPETAPATVLTSTASRLTVVGAAAAPTSMLAQKVVSESACTATAEAEERHRNDACSMDW